MGHRVKVSAAVAGLVLLVCFTLQTNGSHYRLLSDKSLSSVFGLDDNSQTITAGQACEYASGGVTTLDCVFFDDYTTCLQCLAGSAMGTQPGTTGGPGVRKKGTTISCRNATGQQGYCLDQECVVPGMYPAVCSGTPPAVVYE